MNTPNVPPSLRRALARRAILAAGGQKNARHKNRAFTKLSERLGQESPRLARSRQAIEQWYLRGMIPAELVAAVAKLASKQPHEVDPDVFPTPAPAHE
jgi:hypothetical protein